MAAPPPPMPRTRPLGVTILAILTILVGIGLLLIGLLLLALGSIVGLFGGAPMFGLPIAAIGGLVLLVGILMLVSGFGLLKLRMWAWWLAIISFILGAVSSILQSSWVTAGIEVLLIVYLILVRKHFS
jgi:lysylphosphatidylglycerol synthetase-like protein (DUF2156 family)